MEIIDKWENAKADLLKVDSRYQCKVFFPVYPQCDVNHNTICKVFYEVNKILTARQKLIYFVPKDIRRYMMRRFVEKNEVC